ncbi:MAG: hydroxyacid dehydrogenase [Alphaproteobacteria bacterium]|nr:hydroxyacid dehydrogenase [Alphaproteobacteria bacterium]
MKVVLIGTLVTGYVDDIAAQAKTPWTIAMLPDGASKEEIAAALADADAVSTVGWNARMPPAPKLKLIQVAGAGTDAIDFDTIPRGVTVCNAFGHEGAIGEYAVMAMMAWCHEFPKLSRVLDKGVMRQVDRANLVHHDEIAGKTVGVLSLGRIGKAVAERAQALGARVLGCNRSPLKGARGVDTMIAWEDIGRLFAESDFVVVTTALSAETKGLVGATLLRRMKPTGVIVNVARGAVIEEDPLYAALAEKKIGGAILDVWWNYPSAATQEAPPSKHPFHTLPNVILTPHSSGWTTGMRRRRAGQIAANLDHLARGETLDNIVRPPTS